MRTSLIILRCWLKTPLGSNVFRKIPWGSRNFQLLAPLLQTFYILSIYPDFLATYKQEVLVNPFLLLPAEF